jgi:hypothetical protein
MRALLTKMIALALASLALPAQAQAAELVYDFSVSTLSVFNFEKPGFTAAEVTSVSVTSSSSLGTPTIRCTCFPGTNLLVFGEATFSGSDLINFLGFGNATVGGSGIIGAPPQIRNPSFTGRITYNLASVAPVPEPATWAMMIGGFGMVGGAMRSARRKRNVAVSYA